ncbi:unnamed protein product [Candidula unifasciata]|uniref:Ubiquitin carboxyl-terminal hydrolase n=1 Tax=Candidula unifasciata TaxID=100452 RepID=A0A8S3Z085_9EUPU|nr:unnamed protein product [Candidula unifasciata]
MCLFIIAGVSGANLLGLKYLIWKACFNINLCIYSFLDLFIFGRIPSRPLPPGPGPLDNAGRKLTRYNVSSTPVSTETRRNLTPNGITSRIGPLKADHYSIGASSIYPSSDHGRSSYSTYSRNTGTSRLYSVNPTSTVRSDFRTSTLNGISRPGKSSSLIDLSSLSIHDVNHSSNRNRATSVFNDNYVPVGRTSNVTSRSRNYRDNSSDDIFGRSSRTSHLDGERPDGTSRTRYTASVSRDMSPTSPGSRRLGLSGDTDDSPTKSSLSNLSSSSSMSSGNSKYKDGGRVGLRNLGNTCFMNSVLQCLSNTRLLLEWCLDERYLQDINVTTSNMKGSLIKAYANLMQAMWKSKTDGSVSPDAFKTQIQKFAPRFMGYAQQDSQEFLRYLLEGLHEDVNRVTKKPAPIILDDNQLEKRSDSGKAQEYWKAYLNRDNSMIVDIFVGQLKSELNFASCGHRSVTFDPFWDLSIPVVKGPNEVSLDDCIRLFMKEEELAAEERPMCTKCKSRRSCTKSFSIQRFPKILVLHLKRFSQQERFGRKLTTLVDFPIKNLDLSEYASDSKAGEQVRYDLYAVSNHSGGTSSGHYTAYCRNPYSGEWYYFNDARVSSIRSNQVVSPEAYVLFYELSS